MASGFDSQQTVIYKLGNIEAKLDDIMNKLTDHEPRITNLESWKYWLFGVAAAVSTATSAGAWLLHG